MSERTYRIGEAASKLNLKTYVLRFWEMEFPQIAPIRTEKGQRLYTETHLALLRRIRYLLHERGLTIEGARRLLREEAERGVTYTENTIAEIPPETIDLEAEADSGDTREPESPPTALPDSPPETAPGTTLEETPKAETPRPLSGPQARGEGTGFSRGVVQATLFPSMPPASVVDIDLPPKEIRTIPPRTTPPVVRDDATIAELTAIRDLLRADASKD